MTWCLYWTLELPVITAQCWWMQLRRLWLMTYLLHIQSDHVLQGDNLKLFHLLQLVSTTKHADTTYLPVIAYTEKIRSALAWVWLICIWCDHRLDNNLLLSLLVGFIKEIVFSTILFLLKCYKNAVRNIRFERILTVTNKISDILCWRFQTNHSFFMDDDCGHMDS